MRRYSLLFLSALLFLMHGLLFFPANAGGASPVANTSNGMTFKEQGDTLAKAGDFPKAAEAYDKALSSAVKFSDEDRLEMATVIAWGGNLRRAEEELRSLVTNNPGNLKASTQLGRVFFWSGEIDGSLAQAEKVLQKKADDREALLLKADSLRVKGRFNEAIAVYQSILNRGEDFEARNGLAYTYLASGDIAEAKRQFGLLVPALPYQQKEVGLLQSAISEAEAPKAPTRGGDARQIKTVGDGFAGEQRFQLAAEEYIKALKLPHNFTAEERLRMAAVTSWAGRLKEARQELTKILAETPSFTAARIQYARVLLWSGEFDAALKEIDQALTEKPGDRDALLVRANALRLKGNVRSAVPIYVDLVNKNDDYDAREGLTYGFLADGNRVAADKSLSLLKPAFPYQEKSLVELKDLRDRLFNPSVSPGFTYYDDSDGNRVWRYFATGSAWIKNWKLNLDYVHTHAKDDFRNKDSDDLALSGYSRMPFYGGIGGSIGLADNGRFLTGSIRGDLDIPGGSVGVNIAKYVPRDTAELLENDIRVLSSTFSVFHRPTDRITLFGAYSYRDYSDSNNANDLTAGISYLTLRQPVGVSLGYRVRFLDFRRQSRGGYFDPDNFISNVIFGNLSFETSRVYGYVEPYVGYQTYKRYGENHEDYITGGICALGYRFSKHFAAELTGEGSDGGIGVSGAYNYYQVGGRLIFTF